MPYISDCTIKKIIKDSGITLINSDISTDIISISAFIGDTMGSIHSEYQKYAKKFLSLYQRFCNSSHLGDFDDYIEETCIGILHIFKVCHKYDLNNFKSSTFLEDFFELPIEKITEQWNILNMIVILPKKFGNFEDIAKVRKIMTTYMIISMARIFSIIDFIIKDDTCSWNYHWTCGYRYPRDKKMLLILNAIKYNYDVTDMDAMIKSIYEHLSKLYNFFIGKNYMNLQKICSQNPDFDAIIGHHFIKSGVVTKSFAAAKLIKINVLVLLKWIDQSMIDNNDDEQIPIKGLTLPTITTNKSLCIIEV